MNWTIEWKDGLSLDKADNGKTRLITLLLYKGKEVFRNTGIMARRSMTELCERYNADGYEPKGLGVVCLADLPQQDRAAHLVKMAQQGVQEGFTGLILDPVSNAEAQRRYKQNHEEKE